MEKQNKIEAYPLSWPVGWARTKYPDRSRFKVTQGFARDELLNEVWRLGGSAPVLSTNIKLRNDGLPYSSAREPDDSGVAIYFRYKNKPMVFACDRWKSVAENMQAIRHSIAAIRGIERWGASDMLERAFTGFTALPPGQEIKEDCWSVLEMDPVNDRDAIVKRRKELAWKYHPDVGSDPNDAMMAKINRACEEALGGLQ